MGSAMAVWAVMGCQEKSGSWVQWPPLYLSWSHPWIIRQASSHPNWCAPSLPTPPTYNIFLLTGYVLIWFILQTLPCAIKPSWRPVQNDFFCHLVSPTCSFECFSDRSKRSCRSPNLLLQLKNSSQGSWGDLFQGHPFGELTAPW